MFLEEDAKAFYLQHPCAECGSYKLFCKHLQDQYEGGRVLLKYRKEWRARRRGEELWHAHLIRLFDRDFLAPSSQRENLNEADPAQPNVKLAMHREPYIQRQAMKESCVKSHFIND